MKNENEKWHKPSYLQPLLLYRARTFCYYASQQNGSHQQTTDSYWWYHQQSNQQLLYQRLQNLRFLKNSCLQPQNSYQPKQKHKVKMFTLLINKQMKFNAIKTKRVKQNVWKLIKWRKKKRKRFVLNNENWGFQVTVRRT